MRNRNEYKSRYDLYLQGLSDQKIADKLGLTANAITLWRKRNSIPAIERIVGINTSVGKPMESALNPEQCVEMRKFLAGLVTLADENNGRRVDVGEFIKQYRKAGIAWGGRTGTQG